MKQAAPDVAKRRALSTPCIKWKLFRAEGGQDKEVKSGLLQARLTSPRGRQGSHHTDYLTGANQEIPD